MPTTQRTRSARALANDEAIRKAAIESILQTGVDRLSLREIGHQAGLTHGATYARYEDVDELLVDLWNSTLAQRAASLFELSHAATRTPNTETVRAMFAVLRDTTAADVAAIHVLLVSRRFPILHEEIEPFIHQYLERTEPDPDGAYARAQTVFAMLIVRVIGGHQFNWRDDNAKLEELILSTLQMKSTGIARLEPNDAADRIIPEPNESLKSQLAYATFGVVGKSGYIRATITRIARRAACSPGAIYKLYPSKEDLVIASFRDIMRARWLRATNFVDILEEGSITQLLYASASVQNDVRQSFTMETILASTHSDKIRLAVIGQLRELEDAVRTLVELSDDEIESLRFLIRSVTNLAIGVSWMTTIAPSSRDIDFNQFCEPFRLAILRDVLPNWIHISEQIRKVVKSVT
jgi:AcrR family transcriptional regulator